MLSVFGKFVMEWRLPLFTTSVESCEPCECELCILAVSPLTGGPGALDLDFLSDLSSFGASFVTFWRGK